MKKKIIITIISITTILAILGVTYAWWDWRSSDEDKTVINTDMGAITVMYDGGASIKNQKIRPVSDKTSGIIKTITARTNTNSANMNMYLDIIALDEELKHETFKYEFYQNSTLLKSGDFTEESLTNETVECTKNNTRHIVLLNNGTINTTTTTYKLYIWIDGNQDNPNIMQNQSFAFYIHADGQNALLKESKMPDIDKLQEGTLAYKIVNDYNNASKIRVLNGDTRYQLAKSQQLISDIVGNVRYYGKTPNNYIYFNCSDYNNQNDTTCEKWRIIGVFDDKVKLIREESLGNYSWDNKNTSIGAESDYGKNDWTTARLMQLLNPGYETEDIGGSLYYNSKAGTCYYGQNNGTTSCDFTTTGLKNDTTRNLIAEVTYHLGGWNDYNIYSSEVYQKERGMIAYSGRPTSWNGKIGLMYPSDYGYAADFTLCSNTLYNYDVTKCKDNNWLYKSAYIQWTIMPYSVYYSYVWYVYSSGSVNYYDYASSQNGTRPVLHLISEVKVKAGTTGESTNPYQLVVG